VAANHRSGPPRTTRRAQTSSSGIEQVIASRLFEVAFQPIVDLSTGKTFAYEALARSKSSRFHDPPSMFDAAIKTECVGELGRILREMAVQGCPDWPLFLNVHPNELDQRWIVRPDDPLFYHERQVFLEITESVPLSHFNHCSSILRELRGKGCMLAVDDLGAGYSNLKYIADLAPEIVKLDRVLIAGLHRETRLRRLVTSIVRLCEDLGARVVAEGIETVDELGAVQDAGVRYAQGYLLARPATPPPEPVRLRRVNERVVMSTASEHALAVGPKLGHAPERVLDARRLGANDAPAARPLADEAPRKRPSAPVLAAGRKST
jgi:EAL domain-containing protein (putative c-di-GMP-specific phosphodiesterase class I)